MQSASATTAGTVHAAPRSTAGRSVTSSGAAAVARGAQRDDLDRRVGPRVAVAPLVLGGEVVDGATVSSWLCPT